MKTLFEINRFFRPDKQDTELFEVNKWCCTVVKQKKGYEDGEIERKARYVGRIIKGVVEMSFAVLKVRLESRSRSDLLFSTAAALDKLQSWVRQLTIQPRTGKTSTYLVPLQRILPSECLPAPTVTKERPFTRVCIPVSLKVVLAVERQSAHVAREWSLGLRGRRHLPIIIDRAWRSRRRRSVRVVHRVCE